MIFFVLTGLILLGGLLIGLKLTKGEKKYIRVGITFICLLIASLFSFITLAFSTFFPPEMLPENLIYNGETKLSSSTNYMFENAGNINNSELFLTVNGSTFDYEYIDENKNNQTATASSFFNNGSPRLYIIQSTEYDEITLQEYVLKNTFWYSNILDAPRYCLVIPSTSVEYETAN